MRARGIFGVFGSDLPTKGTALVGALLLWAGVTFLGSRTLTLDAVPVSALNVPADLGVSAALPAVAVRVRVPRTLSAEMDPARLLRAFVDLEGSGLGMRTVTVTVTPTDSRVDVLSVTPASLRVTLDPMVERSIPVRVVPTGTPAEGFRIGDVAADPERVRLRGALGMLEGTSAVEAPVGVEGATSTFEGEVSLSVPGGVQATPAQVRVTVAIEQAEVTRTVGLRVRTKGTPAPGYFVRTITTDPATVTVRGVREAIDTVEVVETSDVDVGGAREALERRVGLRLSEGVTLADGRGDVVVRVDLAPLEGTKEVSASISVADVPDGQRVSSIDPPTIRVTVRGQGETFDRLRDEDVRVVVSASGREGTFAARATLDGVRAPSGVRAIAVEQREVTVALESE